MPDAPDPELVFRLLEAASRIKGQPIVVDRDFDGFNLKKVDWTVGCLTQGDFLLARRDKRGHWHIMALLAAGRAELQARREERARSVSLRAWRWLVGVDWKWWVGLLISLATAVAAYLAL